MGTLQLQNLQRLSFRGGIAQAYPQHQPAAFHLLLHPRDEMLVDQPPKGSTN